MKTFLYISISCKAKKKSFTPKTDSLYNSSSSKTPMTIHVLNRLLLPQYMFFCNSPFSSLYCQFPSNAIYSLSSNSYLS